jgi:hypothetical protein
MDERCTTHRADRGLGHRFNPDSGWCEHGCGARDDGRRVNLAGSITRPGTGQPPDCPVELDLDLDERNPE